MTDVLAYIKGDHPQGHPIRYLLNLIANQQGFRITFTDTPSTSSLSFDPEDRGGWCNGNDYWGRKTKLPFPSLFDINTSKDSGVLSAIFELINCTQELEVDYNTFDHYGRYKYTSSFQFHNKCITENIAQNLINQFVESNGLKTKSYKTQFFISHDIDFLYSSKKEDLKWAANNWKVADLIKIIFQELIRKPHWRNIDRVIALDSEYDIRSTFFWLVNEGIGSDGIPNADYKIREEQELLEQIESKGCFNGLHKSASEDSFETEIEKSERNWKINRNHYLRFNTHDHWRAVSEAGIKLDCSLGFAEHYGFRNSYGKPFTPFDIENNRPYNFVEAPLHVMDATFLHYLKTDPAKIGSTVIDFIEKNKQDCVLSILWHNNYLTDYAYKPFLRAYKEILGYIYENQFETITPPEIIDKYLMKWDE